MSEVTAKKKINPFFKVIVAVAGMIAAILVGIGIIYVAGSVSMAMANNSQAAISLFVFCIVGLTLTYCGYRALSANRFQKILILRAARAVFIIGLWGICGISAVGLLWSVSDMSNSQTAKCSTNITDKVQAAVSATVPIGTNLGTGTGFYVSDDGKILTANHVIEGASEVFINYASGKVPLEVVDSAPDYDIALLRPLSQQAGVSSISLSSSITLGSDVIAVGYPANALFAGQASISKGVVSRMINPGDLKLNDIEAPSNLEFVQTDSAVNPGNSGGPLVGQCGVVGVVSAKSDSGGLKEYGIVSEEGITYAINSNSVAARFSLPIDSK